MIRAASSPFVPRFAPALALLALAACKSVEVPKVPGVTPYRMVIQQGNFISQEMVEQLKPGMSKEQVRFVLGTPLVADIFHADRWDYVYYRELPNGKKEQRNLAVIFDGNKLTRVVGDLMPPEGATKPQASGFQPLIKPEPEKPAAKAEPKPAAPAQQQQAGPAAAAPEKPAESWDPPKQNWGTAADAPAEKPQPVADRKEEPAKPAEEAKEAKEEKGFFGRMWDKIRK